MKKFAIITTILLSLVVILYIIRTFAGSPVSITLKWVHQAQFAGLYSAEEKGYYKNKGLDVTIHELSSEITPIDSLLQKKTDFALLSVDEFLTTVDAGEDIVAVAAFYQVSPYAFASLKENNISDPSDYLGKTLGTKGAKPEQKLAYLILLESFGITESDVNFKVLGFETTEFNDLVNNNTDVIDLYRTDQLYFFEKNNVDYDIIYPERYGANINNDILVTRREVIEKNPKLVKKFVRASIQGWEYTIDNPEKAIEHTLKYVTNEAYLDLDYETYILENSIPLVKPTTTSQIGDLNEKQMSEAYDALKKNNFISTDFDVKDFYTKEFLPN